MFGENTELMVEMRMAQLREDAEQAQLLRMIQEGKRSAATLGGMMRRMMTLSGLLVHWWARRTQRKALDKSPDRAMVKCPVSTGV